MLRVLFACFVFVDVFVVVVLCVCFFRFVGFFVAVCVLMDYVCCSALILVACLVCLHCFCWFVCCRRVVCLLFVFSLIICEFIRCSLWFN